MSKRVPGESPEGRILPLVPVSWAAQPRRGGGWSLLEYLRTTRLAYVLGAPVIYGMALPLVMLDLSATAYQYICFYLYGIPRVRRSDYFIADRHRLPYLNGFEKLHCFYCSYANQLIEYAREINARSEQFFCPIKHARPTRDPHRRTARFFAYGNAPAYFDGLEAVRKDWTD